jgi:hypothetical protein
MIRYFSDRSAQQIHTFFVISLLVITGGWWYFFYHPLVAYTIQHVVDIDLLKAQLVRSAHLQKECAILEHNCRSLSDECNALGSHLSAHDHQIVIDRVLRSAATYNLSLVSYETTSSKSSENAYVMRCLLNGSYDQIIDFFKSLESDGYVDDLVSYELSKISENDLSCLLMYEFQR